MIFLMRITYIKELESNKEIVGRLATKLPIFLQKTYIYIKKIFGICNTKKIGENKKLKVLPYTMEELLQKQRWYKKQLEKEKNIILSKNLFLNKELRIQDSKHKIHDGKFLFPFLIIHSLKYICSKIKVTLEQVNVAIVVSNITDQNMQIIIQLAQEVKSISIVTNKIAKFRKLEEKLYYEKGIAIKLSNNKKKSLKHEKIIINMDLNQEELKKYQINRKAIVINVKENVSELAKGFSRN